MTDPPPEVASLDDVPAAVVMVDLQHRITAWNRAAERLYGWTAEEAIGRSVRETILADSPGPDDITVQTHSGRVWTGVVRARCKSGDRRLVYVRNEPLHDAAGQQIGVVGASLDLGEVGLAAPGGDATLQGAIDTVAVRVAGLQRLTTRLMPATSIDEVLQITADIAISTTGAATATVDLVPGTAATEAAGEVVTRRQPCLLRSHTAVVAEDPSAGSEVAARALLPMLVGSEILGLLILDFPTPQDFGDADVQVMLTMATQAAQAVERCRLLAAERESVQRAAFLGRVSDRLSRSLDVGTTLAAAADLLVPQHGEWVVLHVREEERLVARAARHRDATADRRMRELALGRPLDLSLEGGAAEAVRTRASVLHREVPDAVRARLTLDDAHTTETLEATSGLCVPMVVGDEVLGVISLASAGGQAYGERDVAMVEQLAARAAVALAHSRSFQQARSTAVTLQRSLLPDVPPDIPGVQFAWRYRPGTQGELVGGDWYDVFPLDHGRVGLVVGDVMGRGITAAAVMGQLRASARAYAQAGLRPAQVLARLDAALPLLQPEAIATLVLLELDPATATVVASSAGHLPVLVKPPDGPCYLLDPEPGPPLGAGPGSYEELRVVPEHGSTLLLFTDGLVERREDDITTGLRRLREAVDALPSDPQELCDGILADLLAEGVADDTALLAVATSTMDADLAPFISRTLTGAGDLAALRRDLRSRARFWQLPEAAQDDLLTVTTELATNALLHVGPPVVTTVRLEPLAVRTEVYDHDGRHDPLPSLLSMATRPGGPADRDLDAVIEEVATAGTTGRGMHLVSELTSGWGVAAEPDGKTVWADVPLLRAAAEADTPTRAGAPLASGWLRGLPVRLVLASAANTDDLVRELRVTDVRSVDALELDALLRATSRTREPFRVAARDALARGQRLVDVATYGEEETAAQLRLLMRRLEDIVTSEGGRELLALRPDPEIARFRAWWRDEVIAQLHGLAPTPCPFSALPEPAASASAGAATAPEAALPTLSL